MRCPFFLAEKEGFEPSLRLSHTTPLAGEPLRPLGYFSKVLIKILSFYTSLLIGDTAKVTKQGGDALSKQFGELFVAKAREYPYGTRADAPSASWVFLQSFNKNNY